MINGFLEFEDRYCLLEKEIEGFYFWAYTRFNIYMRMEEIRNNTKPSKTNKTNKIKLADLYGIFINCTFHKPLFHLEQKDVLIINHPRRIKNGNYYDCIYTDEIASMLEDNAYTLEFLYGFKHFTPTKTPNLVYMDYIDIGAYFKRKLFKYMYIKQLSLLKEQSIIINNLLINEFGFGPSSDYIFSLLEKRFFWVLFKKKMLKRVIKKINPKVVIEVIGYETNKMIINEICNEMNITCIELQHGVMGRGHLAYNFKNKKKYPFFPNKMLLFSKYWRNITRLPLDKSDVISVGFPYLENNILVYKRDDEFKDYLSIIIISQPEFSSRISNVTIELIDRLESKGMKFHIFYKLHPAEYNKRNDYFNIFENHNNITFIDNNKHSLYYYFAKANIQIGVTSTAIFEGLAFDLHTFIYHIEKTDIYMIDLIDKNIAKMFDNVDELVEMLLDIHLGSNISADISFWEQNAHYNMINQIKHLLNKSCTKESAK